MNTTPLLIVSQRSRMDPRVNVICGYFMAWHPWEDCPRMFAGACPEPDNATVSDEWYRRADAFLRHVYRFTLLRLSGHVDTARIENRMGDPRMCFCEYALGTEVPWMFRQGEEPWLVG